MARLLALVLLLVIVLGALYGLADHVDKRHKQMADHVTATAGGGP
jgi:hypothetical protein